MAPRLASDHDPARRHEKNRAEQKSFQSQVMLGTTVLAAAVVVGLLQTTGGVALAKGANVTLPKQAVYIDPRVQNVLGNNGVFRTNTFALNNPTNTSPPFFQVFHQDFVTKVLGAEARIVQIANNPSFAFAHEAPIYLPATDEVFVASSNGGPFTPADWDTNNQVEKLSLKEIESAVSAAGAGVAVNVSVTKLDLPDTVQMTNGGTGPYHGQLLLANSGRAYLPPNLAVVNPASPHNTTVLIDNFFGRPFNSINDVKVHRQTGNIFFTDVTYGYLNHFRPLPLLPSQVYRLDPNTGAIRVVADGFEKPNGLAFSANGKTAYIADTGVALGFLGINQTLPATIYAFDVDSRSQAFTNRRVFAYVDTGVPDGVQVDTKGNVYSGCGDGVQVWDSTGTLLGKFFVGAVSANMVFAGKGRLVILAETSVYIAHIAAEGVSVAYP